jgi:hypothetical protein
MFRATHRPIIGSSKTVIAASGFTYVFGCRALRWLSQRSGRQPKTYVKPEAAITVFELLMMGGVSSEMCWAIKKHWNNKFYYTVASCWFFLWDLYYGARIYVHQVYCSALQYSKLQTILTQRYGLTSHNTAVFTNAFNLRQCECLHHETLSPARAM